MPPERLDLEVRRNLGELIRVTLQTLSSHLGLILSVTAIIVVPVVVLVDGVWGRALADGADANPPDGAVLASTVLSLVIVPSLVTALHVVIVQRLGSAATAPTVSEALDAAADRVRPAIGAVALYAVVVALGFLALVIPGIWLAVRLYFAAQAAVVDGLRPVDALRRSAELVQGRWWQTFGRLLAVGLVMAILGAGATVATVEIGKATDSGVLYIGLQVVIQTAMLAVTALFATMLFFELRAQRLPSTDGPSGGWPVAPDAPERPEGVGPRESEPAPERPEGAPERPAWSPPA